MTWGNGTSRNSGGKPLARSSISIWILVINTKQSHYFFFLSPTPLIRADPCSVWAGTYRKDSHFMLHPSHPQQTSLLNVTGIATNIAEVTSLHDPPGCLHPFSFSEFKSLSNTHLSLQHPQAERQPGRDITFSTSEDAVWRKPTLHRLHA